MDTVYNYQNYEIIIKKCSDSVYIQFLDKQLFKMYSNTFIDIDVIRFNMTLNIFYKIMTTVIEAIIDEDDEMATLEIFPSMKNLKLSVHHKFHLEFIFELELNLIQEASLSAKDICINKLEQKIDTIHKEHEELKTFVDNYMELTITDNFNQIVIKTRQVAMYNYTMDKHLIPNQSYSIKINTPNIKIIYFSNIEDLIYDVNKIIENTYVLNTSNLIKYNNNFKIVKCKTLTINNSTNDVIKDYNFGYNNLPLSIITLIIEGYISTDNFKEMDLPNLETIKFKDCTGIESIYYSLSHLKSLKNIIINNCPKFQERDLLLTNGYNFRTE
jgi:hypothetical protein